MAHNPPPFSTSPLSYINGLPSHDECVQESKPRDLQDPHSFVHTFPTPHHAPEHPPLYATHTSTILTDSWQSSPAPSTGPYPQLVAPPDVPAQLSSRGDERRGIPSSRPRCCDHMHLVPTPTEVSTLRLKVELDLLKSEIQAQESSARCICPSVTGPPGERCHHTVNARDQDKVLAHMQAFHDPLLLKLECPLASCPRIGRFSDKKSLVRHLCNKHYGGKVPCPGCAAEIRIGDIKPHFKKCQLASEWLERRGPRV